MTSLKQGKTEQFWNVVWVCKGTANSSQCVRCDRLPYYEKEQDITWGKLVVYDLTRNKENHCKNGISERDLETQCLKLLEKLNGFTNSWDTQGIYLFSNIQLSDRLNPWNITVQNLLHSANNLELPCCTAIWFPYMCKKHNPNYTILN